MKLKFKYFNLAIVFLFLQTNLFAQNESQVVSLTVTSQGSSQEEAKNNALRNAIQQTIGVFISTNSTILNDNLVKDEIVSISNGAIQKFQILNEGQLSNNIYFVTLNADVSVSKLNSFIENKGVKSIFNGSLFSFNIKQKELATINETKAIFDLKLITDQLLKSSFEYDLKVGEPKSENGKWLVPINFSTNLNSNFATFYKIVINTIESLSLPETERKNFSSLNLPVFEIKIGSKSFFFRNEKSVIALTEDIFMQIANLALDISITNKVKNVNVLYEFFDRYPKLHITSNNYSTIGDTDDNRRNYSSDLLYKKSNDDFYGRMRDWTYVNDFITISNFNLISHGRNPNTDDIYRVIRGVMRRSSEMIYPQINEFKMAEWIRGQEVIFNYIEYFYNKQPSDYRAGRRLDKDLLKKLNSFPSIDDEKNFKFQFATSNIVLEFNTEEIGKLDGFEIIKN